MMERARAAAALLCFAACLACSAAAPVNEQTGLEVYDNNAKDGCYYNFQHYGEGDRIMTNEPCLNCTCHNRMLMCYLRVCPFTKPIGQDCTVEKRGDQCCPVITCPDVHVDLLTSTSTTSPAEYGSSDVGHLEKYGCSIGGKFFSEGSKVPPNPKKPCELCYCIRNMTACVMQECTLHVDGCVPVYQKDVCCPVRYSCDHPEDEVLMLDDMTTTVRPTPGFLLTTTVPPGVTQDCVHQDEVFADGALIKTEKACEHCYCMKGDIVCVVQECGTPMENEGKNCTSLPPREGQCCPDTYICEGDTMIEDTTNDNELLTTYLPTRDMVATLDEEGSGDEAITRKDVTSQSSLSEDEGSGSISSTTLAETYETTVNIENSTPSIDLSTSSHTEMDQPLKEEHDIAVESLTDKTTTSVEFVSTFAPERSDDLPQSLDSVTEEPKEEITISPSISDRDEGFDEKPTLIKGEADEIKADDNKPTQIPTESSSLKESAPKLDEQPNEIGQLDNSPTILPIEQATEAQGTRIEEELLHEPSPLPEITTLEEKLEGTTEEYELTTVTSDQSPPKEIEKEAAEKETSEPHKSTKYDEPVTHINTEQTTSKIDLLESLTEEPIGLINKFDDEPPEIATENIETETTKPLTEGLSTSTQREPLIEEVDTTPEPLLELPTTERVSDQNDKESTESPFIKSTEKSEELLPTEPNVESTQPLEEHFDVITIEDREKSTPESIVEIITEPSNKDTTTELSTTVPNDTSYGDQTTPMASGVTEESGLQSSMSFETPESTEPENNVKDKISTTTGVVKEPQEITTIAISKEDEQTEKPIETSSLDVTSEPTLSENPISTPQIPIEEETISGIDKDTEVGTSQPEKSFTETSEASQSTEHNIEAAQSIDESTGKTESYLTTEINYSPTDSTSATLSGDKYSDNEKPSSESSTMTVIDTSKLEVDQTTKSGDIPLSETEPSSELTSGNMFEITTSKELSRETVSPESESSTQQMAYTEEFESATNYNVQPETSSISDILSSSIYSPKPTSESDISTSVAVIEESMVTVEPDQSENEIEEEDTIPTHILPHIPGEGDCLVDGVTYTNDSIIPSLNKCQSSCKCVSSIVKCDTIQCSPPPENMINCQPMYDVKDACCPSYICDQPKETVAPESHNQMLDATQVPSVEENNNTLMPQKTSTESYLPECISGNCEVQEDVIIPVQVPELCSSDGCTPPSEENKPNKLFDDKTSSIPETLEADQIHKKTEDSPAIPVEVSEDCSEESCATRKTSASVNPELHQIETVTSKMEMCSGDDCSSQPSGLPSNDCSDKDCQPVNVETQNPVSICEDDKCSIPSAKPEVSMSEDCKDENCQKTDVEPESHTESESPVQLTTSGAECTGAGCDTLELTSPESCIGSECLSKETTTTDSNIASCTGDKCDASKESSLEVSPQTPVIDCVGTDCEHVTSQLPDKTISMCEGNECKENETSISTDISVPLCEEEECKMSTSVDTQVADGDKLKCDGNDCVTPDSTVTDKPCDGDSINCIAPETAIPVKSCDGDGNDCIAPEPIIPSKPCDGSDCVVPDATIPAKPCDGGDCIAPEIRIPAKPCGGDGNECALPEATIPVKSCDGEGNNCVAPEPIIPSATCDGSKNDCVIPGDTIPVKPCDDDDCVASEVTTPAKPCDENGNDCAATESTIQDKPCHGDENNCDAPEVDIPVKPCDGDENNCAATEAISVDACDGDQCGLGNGTSTKDHEICKSDHCETVEPPIKPICTGDLCSVSLPTTPGNEEISSYCKPGEKCDNKPNIETDTQSDIICHGDECEVTKVTESDLIIPQSSVTVLPSDETTDQEELLKTTSVIPVEDKTTYTESQEKETTPSSTEIYDSNEIAKPTTFVPKLVTDYKEYSEPTTIKLDHIGLEGESTTENRLDGFVQQSTTEINADVDQTTVRNQPPEVLIESSPNIPSISEASISEQTESPTKSEVSTTIPTELTPDNLESIKTDNLGDDVTSNKDDNKSTTEQVSTYADNDVEVSSQEMTSSHEPEFESSQAETTAKIEIGTTTLSILQESESPVEPTKILQNEEMPTTLSTIVEDIPSSPKPLSSDKIIYDTPVQITTSPEKDNADKSTSADSLVEETTSMSTNESDNTDASSISPTTDMPYVEKDIEGSTETEVNSDVQTTQSATLSDSELDERVSDEIAPAQEPSKKDVDQKEATKAPEIIIAETSETEIPESPEITTLKLTVESQTLLPTTADVQPEEEYDTKQTTIKSIVDDNLLPESEPQKPDAVEHETSLITTQSVSQDQFMTEKSEPQSESDKTTMKSEPDKDLPTESPVLDIVKESTSSPELTEDLGMLITEPPISESYPQVNIILPETPASITEPELLDNKINEQSTTAKYDENVISELVTPTYEETEKEITLSPEIVNERDYVTTEANILLTNDNVDLDISTPVVDVAPNDGVQTIEVTTHIETSSLPVDVERNQITTEVPKFTEIQQDTTTLSEMMVTVQPTSDEVSALVNREPESATTIEHDLNTSNDMDKSSTTPTRNEDEEISQTVTVKYSEVDSTSPSSAAHEITTSLLPSSQSEENELQTEKEITKDTATSTNIPEDISKIPEEIEPISTPQAETPIEENPIVITDDIKSITTPVTSDASSQTLSPEIPEQTSYDKIPTTAATATSVLEEEKPVVTEEAPGLSSGSSELPSPGEDADHQSPEPFPGPGYGGEPDYEEEDQAFGPGTCRYGGKVYVSAQQIPRDDPCDFCFCFRSDIICLQQSCPPPIHGCHEEPINGFCCPRYECPVSMATTLNVTTTTTTTTTTLPPHFLPHAYKGAAQRRGCYIKGHTYAVGEVVRSSSGPCLHCTCGGDGKMKCDPKVCTPEPMLRQMIAAAVSTKRRR